MTVVKVQCKAKVPASIGRATRVAVTAKLPPLPWYCLWWRRYRNLGNFHFDAKKWEETIDGAQGNISEWAYIDLGKVNKVKDTCTVKITLKRGKKKLMKEYTDINALRECLQDG